MALYLRLLSCSPVTGLLAFAFAFLTIPLGHALMAAAARGGSSVEVVTASALIVSGVWLLWRSRGMASESRQTVLGLLAGVCLWTGLVEYVFKFAALRLGIGETPYGRKGEYVLLEQTWGLLLLVMGYLMFREGIRCRFFLYWRTRLGIGAGEPAGTGLQVLRTTSSVPQEAGRVVGPPSDPINYAPRAAFEYIGVTWAFYVLALLVLDPQIAGPVSWATVLVCLGTLAGGGFCFVRLLSLDAFGYALRYAIPTAVMLWVPVEILVKWKVMGEPWITLHPPTMFVLVAGFILSGGLTARLASERS